MTPKVKKLYDSAIKDKQFLSAIKESDNDEKPGLFSDEIEKVIFSSMYYGWLVAKYEKEWEKHI